jgi:uncharacterized protein
MSSIFLNLPVKDVNQSKRFYEAMGFSVNSQFSDDNAKCMVFSEHIYVMLLNHERFMTFSTKPIADLSQAVACLLSLQVKSITQMNTMANQAIAEGGKEPTEAKDLGFMQMRNIEDLDGHTWEIFVMEMENTPKES